MNTKKTIVVTGATGFIGTHVILHLKKNYGENCKIITTSRSEQKLTGLHERLEVQTVLFNLEKFRADWFDYFGKPDILIHLAWGHLDNFKNPSHLCEELPLHQQFLKSMIDGGLKSLTIAGTCAEYGLKEGLLYEDLPLNPVVAYGQAKAILFRYLNDLKNINTCCLKWLRYFYMYGEGQSPRSILPLLDSSIERGDAVFNMSGGDQIRDYLPVEEVARYTVKAAIQEKITGAINICSGKPITVLDLVRQRILKRKASIELNTGFYPYPNYEPMSFWGDRSKLNQMLVEDSKQ